MQNREPWRFLRQRAEQLYEEGEVKLALRLMRDINRQQARSFETQPEKEKKIVSTH